MTDEQLANLIAAKTAEAVALHFEKNGGATFRDVIDSQFVVIGDRFDALGARLDDLDTHLAERDERAAKTEARLAAIFKHLRIDDYL